MIFHRVRAGPGPTLARPDWPGVSLAPGQGQQRVARPDPWTVYMLQDTIDSNYGYMMQQNGNILCISLFRDQQLLPNGPSQEVG